MRVFYYLPTVEAEEISHHMGNAAMIIASRRRREGLDIDLRPIERQLERVRAGIVEPISLVIDSNKLSSACIVDEVCYEQAVRINDAIQQGMLPFDAVCRPQFNEGELVIHCLDEKQIAIWPPTMDRSEVLWRRLTAEEKQRML